MSSLIVAGDLDLMMLEISIEKLVVPRLTEFDSAIMKKTVVMFRLLDKDWTSVYPQRGDYHLYRGTNSETEPFNGGVSVVFPLPQSSLDKKMEKIDLQLHVHRELSKYFELPTSSQNVGIACIDITDLFNGIIDDLKKKREDNDHGKGREPVGKSLKNSYPLVKEEDGSESGAEVTVYMRLTHLGHSVISEIDVPDDPKRLFYAREETSEKLPYQLREITTDELTSGCWGSDTFLPPKDPRDTICCCSENSVSKVSKIVETPKSTETEVKDTGISDVDDKKGGKKNSGKQQTKKSKNENGAGKKGNGDEDDDDGNKNLKKDGKDNSEETEPKADGDEEAISCLAKPSQCGREGSCNKKDKKGKYGKCGKPDGEGGNPRACGEQRKCSRRKMAAGSATVGFVDKKVSCPIPRLQNVCLCPPSWSNCPTPSTPCSGYQQPVYYPSNYSFPGAQNLCHRSYEMPKYHYAPAAAASSPVNSGCGRIHGGIW